MTRLNHKPHTDRPERQPGPRDKKQQGVVLATSLILLLIMTIIGITALSTTKLEQRMSGNYQATARAFEAAETGLSEIVNRTLDTDDDIPCATEVVPDGYNTVRTVCATKVGEGLPANRAATSISSAQAFRQMIFNVQSTGEARNPDGEVIASTIVHGGIMRKTPN